MNIKRYAKVLGVLVLVLSILLIFIFYFLIYPVKYKNIVQKYSAEYSINIETIYAVIKAESNFNKNAVSLKGAVGLMQLLPSTADWISNLLNENDYDLKDAETNIKYGTYYLRYLYNKFEYLDTAICAYNAGEGTVRNWLNNPEYSSDFKTLNVIPYKETREYLNKVKFYERVYKGRGGIN